MRYVDELENRIHSAEAEAWECRRELAVLEDKIVLLEKYLGIELVKTKEHYQEKSNG